MIKLEDVLLEVMAEIERRKKEAAKGKGK